MASDPTSTARPARRRGARWEQLGYGIQVPAGLTGRDRLLAELAAHSHLRPASGVWSSLTALRVHDVWLPDLPPALPHFMAMGEVRGEVKPTRARLRVARHPVAPSGVEVDGVIVQPGACPSLGGDHAGAPRPGRRDRWGAPPRAHHHRGPSVGRLRAAPWGAADARGAGADRCPRRVSVGDHAAADARRLWDRRRAADEIFDDAGRFAARADLWVRGTRLLQEYDGAQHRDATERRRDLERERRIGDAGCVRRGYTAKTVIDHPYETLRPAAEALGRPVPPSATPWLALLAGSLRVPSGRRLFLERLRLDNWW